MKLNIRSRVIMGFLLLVALVLLSGVAGYVGFNPAREQSHRFLELARGSELATRAEAALHLVHTSLQEYARNRSNPVLREDVDRLLATAERRVALLRGPESMSRFLAEAEDFDRTLKAYRRGVVAMEEIHSRRTGLLRREKEAAATLETALTGLASPSSRRDGGRWAAQMFMIFSKVRRETLTAAWDDETWTRLESILSDLHRLLPGPADGDAGPQAQAARAAQAALAAYGDIIQVLADVEMADRALLLSLDRRNTQTHLAMEASQSQLLENMATLDAAVQETLGRTTLVAVGTILGGLFLALGVVVYFMRVITRPVNVLENIISKSHVVALVWDAAPDRPLHFVSDNINRFGHEAEAFTSGRVTLASLVHAEDRAQVLVPLLPLFGPGQEEITREYRIVTSTGDVRWVEDRTRIMRCPDGRPTGFQTLLLDITTRRQAEAELYSLNMHLELTVEERTKALSLKAAELEQANRRLLELDELKSSFISSVSHELRTPLTSVRGFAKLISRDFARSFGSLAGGDEHLERLAARILENLAVIDQEGDRLTRLINDVLDLNKIESGRMNWNDRPLDVRDCIRRGVKSMRGDLERKPGVVLREEISSSLPSVTVDADKLEQVVINLLSNAIKFTDAGTIAVSARWDEPRGRVVVQVADTGAGIKPEYLQQVFERFQQAPQDTLVDKPRGTGLGLAISRQIIEHYGGTIGVVSELGKGSVFSFDLPVRCEAATVPEADVAPRAAIAEDDRPMVLVVDDDRPVALFLARLLEGQGFRAAMAFDGETAVRKARQLKPSLITMDIMMPVLDGKSAINIMRNDPELFNIPVLVVTALQAPDAAGGDAALIKPFDDDAFLDAVHSLLKQRYAKAPILALSLTEAEQHRVLFAPFQRRVIPCDTAELWQRVEAGYQGVVVIPARAETAIDLERLLVRPNIQVLIMPEMKTPPSA